MSESPRQINISHSCHVGVVLYLFLKDFKNVTVTISRIVS